MFDWTFFLIGLGIFLLCVLCLLIALYLRLVEEKHRHEEAMAKAQGGQSRPRKQPYTPDYAQPLEAREYEHGYHSPMEMEHPENR